LYPAHRVGLTYNTRPIRIINQIYLRQLITLRILCWHRLLLLHFESVRLLVHWDLITHLTTWHALIQHLLTCTTFEIWTVRLIGVAGGTTVHFIDLGLRALDRSVADGRVHARVFKVRLFAWDWYLLEGLVA
jgi:hypothetical protein